MFTKRFFALVALVAVLDLIGWLLVAGIVAKLWHLVVVAS